MMWLSGHKREMDFQDINWKNWIKRNKVEMPQFLLKQRTHKCAEWKRTSEIGMNVSQGINFILDCCDIMRAKIKKKILFKWNKTTETVFYSYDTN